MSATDRNRSPRSRREPPRQVPSPLDPFLRDFLRWLADRPDGLIPPRDLQVLAEAFDWQSSFAEVLFTSARSRGLLQPMPVRGARSRVAWHVSNRGVAWLEPDA